jgi:hypothetical protein
MKQIGSWLQENFVRRNAIASPAATPACQSG